MTFKVLFRSPHTYLHIGTYKYMVLWAHTHTQNEGQKREKKAPHLIGDSLSSTVTLWEEQVPWFLSAKKNSLTGGELRAR